MQKKSEKYWSPSPYHDKGWKLNSDSSCQWLWLLLFSLPLLTFTLDAEIAAVSTGTRCLWAESHIQGMLYRWYLTAEDADEDLVTHAKCKGQQPLQAGASRSAVLVRVRCAAGERAGMNLILLYFWGKAEVISVPLVYYLFREPLRGDSLLPLHQRLLFEVMTYLYKEKQRYGQGHSIPTYLISI